MFFKKKRKEGRDANLDRDAYKALFDHLPDCLFLYDQSGRIVDATHGALELFGYTRNELASLDFGDLYPEDAGATVKAELRRVFDTSIARFEQQCRKNGGQLFSAEISASRCHVAGEPLIQVIVRDVDETLKIVRCLRENDEITRAILGCALDAIISVDDRGDILEFNPAAEKMFGFTRQEALGSPVADLVVPPSMRETYHLAFRKCVIGTGDTVLGRRIEGAAMRRDGEVFPIELRVGEVRRGQSLTFTAYLSDISIRKEAVSRLAEEKQKFETILSATSDGMVLLGRDGRVSYANRSFEEMVGCSGDVIRGSRAIELAERLRRLNPDPEDVFDYALGVGGPIEEGKGPLYRRCRISGVMQRTLRVSWCALGAEADGGVGRLAVFRDVTWEDAVHRAKDDLIGNVSHELRTPLTSIQGFVQLLNEERAGAVSDKQKKVLGIINENVDRLNQLVADLLDVDRVSTSPLSVADVDLADLLDEVIIHEKGRAAKKALAVNLRCETPHVITGDRERLYQVFQNLIANAIKYTREGGVTVTVERVGGEHTSIAVEDSGIGLSEAELPRVFDRFFRSSTEYATEVGGTGLGLSIVKALVERHGGDIEVTSEPGVGTCFRVVLPVEVDEQAALESPEPVDLLIPENAP